MISFKLYRASISFLLAALVSVYLSFRYKAACDRLFESPSVPSPLLTRYSSRRGWTESLFLTECSLEEFSKKFESRPDALVKGWGNDEKCVCVLRFFKSCVDWGAIIKQGHFYKLSPNLSEERYLKAIGFMMSSAYESAIYLNMEFDPDFLAKTFTSYVTIANSLPENVRMKMLSGFYERCYMGSVQIAENGTKFKFGKGDIWRCKSAVNFQSSLLIHITSANEYYPYLKIIEGRQRFFSDEQVFEQESKRSEFISNIQKRISETEPLRFRNWWRHGLQTHHLSSGNKTELFNCLKSLSNDQLKVLFKMSTGLDEMPFGGAKRIQKISIDAHQYETSISKDKNEWKLEHKFSCDRFKRRLNLF